MEQQGGVLLRYVGAIFRNKSLAVIVAGLVLVVTVLDAALTPRRYGSTMKILVQNARAMPVISAERLNSSPSAAGGSDALEAEINSEVELLQSSDLLEGLAAIRGSLRGQSPAHEGSIQMAHDVLDLQRSLEITPIRKTNFVQVSLKDADPRVAQKCLEWLSTAFLDKHAGLRRPVGTYQFFAQQADRSEEQLRNAEATLLAFQLAHGVVSLTQQKSIALENYNRLAQEAGETRSMLGESRNRLSNLNGQMNSMEGRITTQVRNSPDANSADQLNTLLATLNNKRTELLTRYQPTEPLVQEIGQQIATTEVAIRRARAQDNVETVSDNNPVRLTLEQDMRKTQADEHGQVARLATLQAQATAEKVRLNGYERIGLQEDALERNVQQLRQNAETYAQKRDQARIDDELDRNKIVDISIAQQPTFSMMPVQPHRFLTLVLGSFAALFFSLTTIFVKDALRDTVFTPAELEAMTGCPVLATLPTMRADLLSNRPSLVDSPIRVPALGAMSES